MPIIGNMANTQESESNSGWKNPNSILRNTIRVRAGEFALMKFISDRDEGSKDRFHRVDKLSPSGKQFSEYIYCVQANKNDKGQIVPGTCEFCVSADKLAQRTSPRYGYWAFCYAVFHAAQNPNIGKYDDAVEWEYFTVGQRQMFRELVMKPQFLVLSHTTWEQLDQKATRYGTLTDVPYEYSNIKAQGKTSYIIERSELDVPDVDEEIAVATSALPSIEQVCAGQVTEFEFVTVGKAEENGPAKDVAAFDAAVAPVEEEEKTPVTPKKTAAKSSSKK